MGKPLPHPLKRTWMECTRSGVKFKGDLGYFSFVWLWSHEELFAVKEASKVPQSQNMLLTMFKSWCFASNAFLVFFTAFLNKKETTEKRSRFSKRKSGPSVLQKETRYSWWNKRENVLMCSNYLFYKFFLVFPFILYVIVRNSKWERVRNLDRGWPSIFS